MQSASLRSFSDKGESQKEIANESLVIKNTKREKIVRILEIHEQKICVCVQIFREIFQILFLFKYFKQKALKKAFLTP